MDELHQILYARGFIEDMHTLYIIQMNSLSEGWKDGNVTLYEKFYMLTCV